MCFPVTIIGVGNFVIFRNITEYDYRLQDLGNSKNVAQDAHTNTTGYGLSMVSTDIANTTRPQNTNYDIGCFEVVAGASTCGPTSPLSANYEWQCSDNCIETNIDAADYNITFSGTGTITFSNLTNTEKIVNECKFIILENLT